MYLASLKQKYKTKEMVTTFQGYCHRDVISDGQWFDMTNMSARKYPAITTRPNRQIVSKVNGEAVSNVAAMVDMDGLVWLGKDGSLHAGGNVLPNFYTYTEAERQMVPMGGYLIVFPDKVWANAVKLRMGGEMVEDVDYGKLEAHWEQGDDAPAATISEPNAIWMSPCQEDGSFWDYMPSDYEVVEALPGIANPKRPKLILTTSYPYKKYEYVSGRPAYSLTGYYDGYVVSADKPLDPADGMLWMNTGVNPPVLQKWMAYTRMWTIVPCYIRLHRPAGGVDAFTGIGAGDAVTLSIPPVLFSTEKDDLGTAVDPYKYYGNPYSTDEFYLGHPDPVTIENVPVINAGDNWIAVKLQCKIAASVKLGSVHRQLVNTVMSAFANQGSTEVGMAEDELWPMTNDELREQLNTLNYREYGFPYYGQVATSVSRKIPDMDYVIESNNRLWGCFYGERDGKMLNEIYASKLGDFKNWNCFQGLSTDSYAASRGSDGPWTGAITMNNYPLFFKRNCLEKVYISASGAHQIATTKMPGVQPGSWRSMQIVDGVLFYLSDTGVMVYDGSLPDHISNDFGNVRYSDGVAGKQGYNYYLSVKTQDGSYSLFNLDTTKGVWHREDDTRLTQTADRGDVLYMLTEDGRLLTPGTLAELDEGELEGDFTWEIVSGAIGYQRAEQEYLLRLIPRIKLELGGSALVHVMFDDNGDWQRVACIENNSTHSVTIPVKTRRCDHFRIKISGIGGVTLFTIVREIEKGSLEG